MLMKRNFELSFIVLYERPFDTQKNVVYCFSISFNSFQRYEGLNIPYQRDIEKGLGTRICDVID